MSKFPLGPWTDAPNGSFTVSQRYVNTRYNNTNGNVTILVNPPTYGMLQGQIRSRSGYNSGADRTTPRAYSLSLQSAEHSLWQASDSFRGTNKSLFSDYWSEGGWPVDRTFPNAGFTTFESELVAKLLPQTNMDIAFAKFIQQSSSALKGLVVLGEGRETARLLTDSVSLISKIHNSSAKELFRLVKSKNRNLSQFIRNVAAINLTWSFGIEPILSDVNSALEALSPQGSRLRGSYSGSSKSTAVHGRPVSLLQGVRWPLSIAISGDIEILDKVGARFTVHDVGTRLPWQLGLSYSEVLPALWELLPYSWLVDYVTNMSDFVNLASLRRADISHGYKLTLTKVKIRSVCHPISANPYPAGNILLSHKAKAGVASYRTVTFNRDPFDPTSYVPSFRFEVPSLRQAANVASVAVLRFVKPPLMPHHFQSRLNWDRLQKAVRSTRS